MYADSITQIAKRIQKKLLCKVKYERFDDDVIVVILCVCMTMNEVINGSCKY